MENLPITVQLPICKSIAARLFMLDAYQGIAPRVSPLEPQDVIVLAEAIDRFLAHKPLKNPKTLKTPMPLRLSVGDNGTAMRFLIPFAASREGRHTILTGSPRMLERPIGPLVDALRGVGAGISYLGKEGYPPVLINGKALNFNEIDIDGSLSSQYVSALMLLCASLPTKPAVKVVGTPASAPYIELTRCCIENRPQRIPRDWSSASYLYEAVAIGATSRTLSLAGLSFDGIPQPDMRVAEIFRGLGVKSHEFGASMLIKRLDTDPGSDKREYDLSSTPDLAPALAVTLAELGIPFTLTGLANLRIKESDRISALAEELNKLGVVTCQTADTLSMPHACQITRNPVTLSSHGDHRIYMAFAVLSLKYPDITVEGADCSAKSFPLFDFSVMLNLKDS